MPGADVAMSSDAARAVLASVVTLAANKADTARIRIEIDIHRSLQPVSRFHILLRLRAQARPTASAPTVLR